MPSNPDVKRAPEPRPVMDAVNDASFDSFPASDPPSWSSLRIGPPRPSEPLALGVPVEYPVST